MWIDALCLRARSGRWADCAPASARADALFRHWHGLRRKAFPCSEPGGTRRSLCPANSLPGPAHVSHHEPRERRVAAGARRVLAFYRRRVTSPPPLRSSEPTPSAKRVPAWERSSGGRGSDPTRANRGAFGKLSKWRCERVNPPSAARKVNDGPRGKGQTRRRESRVQLQEVWHRHHGAAAMEPVGWAVLQIRRSPLPRFPLGSRRPKFRGLDTVALRLEVQCLAVYPEEWRRGSAISFREGRTSFRRLSPDLMVAQINPRNSRTSESDGGAAKVPWRADQSYERVTALATP